MCTLEEEEGGRETDTEGSFLSRAGLFLQQGHICSITRRNTERSEREVRQVKEVRVSEFFFALPIASSHKQWKVR